MHPGIVWGRTACEQRGPAADNGVAFEEQPEGGRLPGRQHLQEPQGKGTGLNHEGSGTHRAKAVVLTTKAVEHIGQRQCLSRECSANTGKGSVLRRSLPRVPLAA